jgi:hypothetical protein
MVVRRLHMTLPLLVGLSSGEGCIEQLSSTAGRVTHLMRESRAPAESTKPWRRTIPLLSGVVELVRGDLRLVRPGRAPAASDRWGRSTAVGPSRHE